VHSKTEALEGRRVDDERERHKQNEREQCDNLVLDRAVVT